MITIFGLNRLVTRIGAAVAVLFLFFLVDNFVTGHFSGRNVLRALPGTSQPISGELTLSVSDASGLVYSAESRYLALEIEEARGRLWRGRLMADPAIRPGEYFLKVWVSGQEAPEKIRPSRILIFAEQKQLRASYPSLTRRLTGIAPMWMALFSLPLVIAALAGSFFLSSRQEIILERNGIVPILRMISRKQGWEIHFPLGARHGVAPADELILMNERFEASGTIKVEDVDEDFGKATVPFNAKIAPSWWVVRNGASITPEQ